jgi:hypothetical protein
MSRPFTLTPEQLAAIPERVARGESRISIARDYGVTHSAICYHLDGGKASRVLGLPWTKPLAEAQAALLRRDLPGAAGHFDQVARILRQQAP